MYIMQFFYTKQVHEKMLQNGKILIIISLMSRDDKMDRNTE